MRLNINGFGEKTNHVGREELEEVNQDEKNYEKEQIYHGRRKKTKKEKR